MSRLSAQMSKETYLALSRTKAEFIAAGKVPRQIVWLKLLMLGITELILLHEIFRYK